MSWSMWHVYGYGFSVDETDDAKMIAFCENHRKSLANYRRKNELFEILDEVKKNGLDPDISYTSEIMAVTDNGTLGDIIAHVIREETNIGVISPGLTDEAEDVVLFGPMYPWQMVSIEQTLPGPEGLYRWLRPYIQELGVKENLEEYDLIYSG